MEETDLIETPRAFTDIWPPISTVDGVKLLRSSLLHQLCAISAQMRSFAVREILSRFDLDIRDWAVLAAICELETCSQREIVKHSKLDKVAVNRAATRLKDRDLVVVLPNRLDARSHLLELSSAGHETVRYCTDAVHAMEQQVLAELPGHDESALRRLLNDLAHSLDIVDRADPLERLPIAENA